MQYIMNRWPSSAREQLPRALAPSNPLQPHLVVLRVDQPCGDIARLDAVVKEREGEELGVVPDRRVNRASSTTSPQKE